MINNGDLENITYNVFEDDVKLLIPSKSVTSVIEEKGQNVLRLVLKLVFLLTSVVILSTIFLCGYLHMFSHERHIVRGVGDSCVPLQPVDKVMVSLVVGHNYSCHDNDSCAALLQMIEEVHNGSSYNFVIGSGMELYIGLGFKCRVNSHLNDLHIKLLWSDDTFVGETNRLLNVIDEGLKCGYILPDYYLRYLCDGNETQCASAEDFLDETEHSDRALIGHTFHSPASETGMILHKAVRWTLCGKASHETKNITKSKVIVLESLRRESCLPFMPVDKIVIEFVDEANNLTCSDHTCANVIDFIESHHDGFKYNFVMGSNTELYVGLGFRCIGNEIEKSSLRIKVLLHDDFTLYIAVRITELIKQGLLCHKISGNYSISYQVLTEKRVNELIYCLRFIMLPDLNNIEILAENSLDFPNNHNITHAKYIHPNHNIVVCSEKHSPDVAQQGATTGDSDRTTTSTNADNEEMGSSPISRLYQSLEEDYYETHDHYVSDDESLWRVYFN